LFFTG